ncbi:MAG: alpha,alpha-trehalose-phosphate synthase (UDP-forming) [Rhodospirillaceae bacterium]
MSTGRLIVVSNRVAVPDDNPARAGGLAVALRDALQANGGIWFGWSGKTTQKSSTAPRFVDQDPVTYALVDLGRSDYNEYYNGFANRTLWPLFHYRMSLAEFDRQNYMTYRKVNSLFAQLAFPLIEPDDTLWVHDYHLIPFGGVLRDMGVTNRMGIFLHTPFPAMEVYRALPSHARLAEALMAYDVIGFQTENDRRAFADYITLEAGGTEAAGGLLQLGNRTTLAKVYPIGIDAPAMAQDSRHSVQTTAYRRLSKSLANRSLLLGVDRLDYSKGIPQRLAAFAHFIEKYPEHRGKVSLMQIAPLSRSEVPEYKRMRDELERLSGNINGKFGDFDWMPIRWLTKNFQRSVLAGFMRQARIGLVTPMRDGMNLVAKEYVASQNPSDPGVLVLSTFAGAARELTRDEALLVNPYDQEDVADAIHLGLTMPLEERLERWTSMMDKITTNSLDHWRDTILDDLRDAPYTPEALPSP